MRRLRRSHGGCLEQEVGAAPNDRRGGAGTGIIRWMTDQPSRLLDRLVGETLSSVIFVADYLQLDFNGPRLTAHVWPRVRAFDETMHFGDRGYRDALCAFIGREVTAVVDSHDEGVVVRFGPDAVVINPEPWELEGVEIAMLQMSNEEGDWDIWRPGEGCFAERDW